MLTTSLPCAEERNKRDGELVYCITVERNWREGRREREEENMEKTETGVAT
jgi:hypothetical protein